MGLVLDMEDGQRRKLHLKRIPPRLLHPARGQPVTGAAQRRRERRLRAMPRHEQLSIAMAPEAALHHSVGPQEKKVEMQQNASQANGTRARKGEVNVTHNAPPRQTTPHRGRGRSSSPSLWGRRGVIGLCGVFLEKLLSS